MHWFAQIGHDLIENDERDNGEGKHEKKGFFKFKRHTRKTKQKNEWELTQTTYSLDDKNASFQLTSMLKIKTQITTSIFSPRCCCCCCAFISDPLYR